MNKESILVKEREVYIVTARFDQVIVDRARTNGVDQVADDARVSNRRVLEALDLALFARRLQLQCNTIMRRQRLMILLNSN